MQLWNFPCTHKLSLLFTFTLPFGDLNPPPPSSRKLRRAPYRKRRWLLLNASTLISSKTVTTMPRGLRFPTYIIRTGHDPRGESFPNVCNVPKRALSCEKEYLSRKLISVGARLDFATGLLLKNSFAESSCWYFHDRRAIVNAGRLDIKKTPRICVWSLLISPSQNRTVLWHQKSWWII